MIVGLEEIMAGDRAYIQLDNNGHWQTITSMDQGDTQKLQIEMRTIKRSYPNNRVRAVDDDGHLLDLLS